MSDEVAPNVEAMLAALDGVFSGKLRKCVNGVWVTLENAAGEWRMDLLSAGRCLTERQAREIGAGLPVPDGAVWTSEANGAKWAAVWEVD